MTTALIHRPIHILVVNPNSSHEMTHGMEEAIKSLHLPDSLKTSTYTGPASCPASINDGADIDASAAAVYEDLSSPSGRAGLAQYDAVLVACYSVHPLVRQLAALTGAQGKPLLTTGIFEASVLTALSLLPPHADAPPERPRAAWGVVTTGRFWEAHLTTGVAAFLGQAGGAAGLTTFAGVESTGLDAGDFHGKVPPDVVRAKLRDATRRLLGAGSVECVVMGCAGMAGLEAIVREVAIEVYGPERGNRVYVVDGVRAGVGLLEQMVRNRRMFQSA